MTRELSPLAPLPSLETLVVFAIPPYSKRTISYEYSSALELLKSCRHVWLEGELLRANYQRRSSSLPGARGSASAATLREEKVHILINIKVQKT